MTEYTLYVCVSVLLCVRGVMCVCHACMWYICHVCVYCVCMSVYLSRVCVRVPACHVCLYLYVCVYACLKCACRCISIMCLYVASAHTCLSHLSCVYVVSVSVVSVPACVHILCLRVSAWVCVYAHVCRSARVLVPRKHTETPVLHSVTGLDAETRTGLHRTSSPRFSCSSDTRSCVPGSPPARPLAGAEAGWRH